MSIPLRFRTLLPVLAALMSAGALFACETAPTGEPEPRPTTTAAAESSSSDDTETSEATEAEDVLKDVLGRVVKVGNIGFGLVPDDAPGTRYAPTEPLGQDFQIDGLQVRFSGEVGSSDDIPGRGRRWGTPLKVTHIAKVEPGDDEGR